MNLVKSDDKLNNFQTKIKAISKIPTLTEISIVQNSQLVGVFIFSKLTNHQNPYIYHTIKLLIININLNPSLLGLV